MKNLDLGLYILDGKKPVHIADVLEWAKAFEKINRIVKQDQIGDIFISTIFLGVDYGTFSNKPALFETRLFEKEENQNMWRYSTWEEAEEHHMKLVEQIKTKE